MSRVHEEISRAAAVRQRLEELKATDPDLVLDTIEGETDLLEIMAWLLRKLGDEDYMQDGITARIADLQTRRRDSEGRSERLRDTLLRCVEATGEKSVRLAEATLSVANRVPGIATIDEALLPETFFRVERKASRTAINAALKAGEEVPGVTLSNGGSSLTVRRK